MLYSLNVCQLWFHERCVNYVLVFTNSLGFGVFIMFSSIHYVLEYSLYYSAIFGSPGENHECAGMHNGGNVDRSIWADRPHSSTGGRTGACCLLGIQYSVCSIQYSVFTRARIQYSQYSSPVMVFQSQ